MTKAARALLSFLRTRKLKLAAAESCTGGLLTAALTEIPGSSDVVDRGFVTYSDAAKQKMLGVPARTLTKFGAVSRQTALAMAKGALSHADANIAVAITGIAGPGGGSDQEDAWRKSGRGRKGARDRGRAKDHGLDDRARRRRAAIPDIVWLL